jgi:hypothetical protein
MAIEVEKCVYIKNRFTRILQIWTPSKAYENLARSNVYKEENNFQVIIIIIIITIY